MFDYLELIRYSCLSVKLKTNHNIRLAQCWSGAFSGVGADVHTASAVDRIAAAIFDSRWEAGRLWLA